MLKTTEAIVLKNRVFGEADMIVTCLSRDFGIINLFAKSPRKIKSRFGSSLEPLTHSRVAFLGKEHASLPRLTRSDIINPYQVLREDYHCFNDLAEVLKLNLTFIHERVPVGSLFDLLQNTLQNLTVGADMPLSLLYYKIRFLQLTGYMPSLEVCGRCGHSIKPETNGKIVHDFYVEHGAILCMSCCAHPDCAITISGNALNFYYSLNRWHISMLKRIKAPHALVSELTNIINAHLAHIRRA
jgi:DNA repair protein RecO (recombination protein O)